jgi:hypothetical protein
MLSSSEMCLGSCWRDGNGPLLKVCLYGSLRGVLRAQSVQRLLGCILSALEGLIGPQVSPVAVAAAISNTEIVQVAVDCPERGGALVIENDVRVTQLHRFAA